MLHRTSQQASTPIVQASSEIASPVASKLTGRGPTVETQYALHVTDYNMATALAHLRAIGACNRRVPRRLTDDEFDDNQFSLENGDGGIY